MKMQSRYSRVHGTLVRRNFTCAFFLICIFFLALNSRNGSRTIDVFSEHSPTPERSSDTQSPPHAASLFDSSNSTVKGPISCNREGVDNGDQCLVHGDIRLVERKNLVVVLSDDKTSAPVIEKIKPHWRKHDADCMKSIWQIVIRSISAAQYQQDLAEFTVEDNRTPISVSDQDRGAATQIATSEGKKQTEPTPWNRMDADQWSEVFKTSPPEIRDVSGKVLDTSGYWRLFEEPEGQALPGEGKLPRLDCDFQHNVTGILFSTGGFIGNLYHDFSDYLIPLYIAAEHLDGEVVFIIAEWHYPWLAKYGYYLSRLSNYRPVLLGQSDSVHCFRNLVVGVRRHHETQILSERMPRGKNFTDFQKLFSKPIAELQGSFLRAQTNATASEDVPPECNPLFTLFVRRSNRNLTNYEAVKQIAVRMGFTVQLLDANFYTPLSDIWKVMQETDVAFGVHGAAMTYSYFMRPGTVLVEIVPLATEWLSRQCFEKPGKAMGLQYIKYDITGRESSLYAEYGKNDPIIKDPMSMWSKGFGYVKSIYLDRQNVTLSLKVAKRLIAEARGRWLRAHRGIQFSRRDFVCQNS